MKSRRLISFTIIYLVVSAFFSDVRATLNDDDYHGVLNCNLCEQAVQNYMIGDFQEDFDNAVNHTTFFHQTNPGIRSFFYDHLDMEDGIIYPAIDNPTGYRFNIYNDIQYVSIVRNFEEPIGVYKNNNTDFEEETNTVWIQFEVNDGEIFHLSTGYPGRNFN